MAKVPCPHCQNTLFETGMLDPKGVFGKKEGSPAVEQSDEGDFMTCKSCKRRVRLERVPNMIGTIDFRVAAKQ